MTKCYLKRKIRELEAEQMNGRQAAKLASIRIAELENLVAKQSQDIKDYNAAMIDTIAGKSPCSWCEENRLDECTSPCRGSAACSNWWLRFPASEGGDPDEEEGKTEGDRQDDGPVFGVEEQ